MTWPWPKISPNSRWTGLRTGFSATYTPAAAASKKRAMQEPKDQRALGGKDSYQSISACNRPPPYLRGTAHSPIRLGHRRTAPVRTQAGAGDSAKCAPCTNAGKPANHPFTACPLSPRATSAVNPDTSSAPAPTRIHRQTTAAVPG